MGTLLSIGDFARMTLLSVNQMIRRFRLTARALRHRCADGRFLPVVDGAHRLTLRQPGAQAHLADRRGALVGFLSIAVLVGPAELIGVHGGVDLVRAACSPCGVPLGRRLALQPFGQLASFAPGYY